MIIRPAIAAIPLLALAVISRADTYTWAGPDGTFSNPAAWLDALAPAAPGSPTDCLLFPTPTNPDNAYTATLDSPAPWTLNSLLLGTTAGTSPAYITLTGLPQSSLLFDGPNPSITLDPLGYHAINIPIVSTSSLKISGANLSLNAPLSFTTANSQLTIENAFIDYVSNTPPSGLNETLISSPDGTGAALRWHISPTPSQTTLSFGSGPITLNGPAYFSLNGPRRAPLDQTPLPTVEFTNPFIVNGYCNQFGSSGFASVTFSGTIQLGGILTVFTDNAISLSGPITLDQSVTRPLWFTAANASSPAPFKLAGNILDDPNPSHTARNPLVLESLAYQFTISGTANTYSTGTVINSGIITVAPDSSLGTGDVLVGSPDQPWNHATVLLQGSHAFSSTAHITVASTLSVVGPAGAIPQSSQAPTLLPYSTLILGDGLATNSDRYPDSLPIALHDSTLKLQGFGNTAETVGPISFSGVSNIFLQNPGNGTCSTTLHAPSLSRTDHAILLITPTAGTLGVTSDNTLQFTLDAPPASTNGILPPYIQTADLNQYPSFATYSSQGIATVAYTSIPTNGGTGTEVVEVFHPFPPPQPPTTNTESSPALTAILASLGLTLQEFLDAQNALFPTPAVPPLPPTTGPLTLTGNTDVFALRTNTDILNPSSGPAALTLRSGALITYNFSLFDACYPIHIEPDVDFGPGEAIINVAAPASFWPPTELSGKVTIRGGLTKFGAGELLLSNPKNDITGPITVLQGSLTFTTIPNPTSTEPITLYNTTQLTSLSSQILSRPLQIVPDASSARYAILSIPEGKSLTLAGPITGFGELDVLGAGTLVLSSSISWQSSGWGLNVNTPVLLPHQNVSLPTWIVFSSGLSGSGTISDFNTLFIEGKITPGTAPGEIASLRFDSPNPSRLGWFESVALDLAPAGQCDQLLFTGPLLLEPTLAEDCPTTLALNPLAPLSGLSYTLISASSITGTFSQVTGLPDGYSLQYTPTSILLLPNSPTPEPATLATLLLTTPFLLLRRKNKKPL